jgi:DnaJ-class molecular chaperone
VNLQSAGGKTALLKKTYYLTLGCRMAEPSGGLRNAFRDLVKRYHPDSVGSNGTPFFQEIVEAYHVLSDSDRRDNIYPCPLCRGSGEDDGAACPVCDELGVIEEKESIPVAIPAMLERNQQIEIPLRSLGIHNYYLRLRLDVAGNGVG